MMLIKEELEEELDNVNELVILKHNTKGGQTLQKSLHVHYVSDSQLLSRIILSNKPKETRKYHYSIRCKPASLSIQSPSLKLIRTNHDSLIPTDYIDIVITSP